MPMLTSKARTKATCGDPQVYGSWQPHYQVWEPKGYGFKSCLQSHRVPWACEYLLSKPRSCSLHGKLRAICMGAQLQPGSEIRWYMQRALGSGVLCPGDTEPETVQERLYIKKEVGRGNHYRIAASLSQSVASPKLHLQLLGAWDGSSLECPTYRRDSN